MLFFLHQSGSLQSFLPTRYFKYIFEHLCQVFAMLFVGLPPCSSSITMLCCYHVWINLWPATRDKCLASGGSITIYNNVLQCIAADITSSLHYAPLVRSDKYFVSVSTCNPTACSHWLTQSQKEADIYYLFIIG